MFDSLKSWMTCPITVIPFKGVNAAADKEYGAPEEIYGYFTGEVVTLDTAAQTKVVSGTQIYFDPSVYTINQQDRILVDGQEKDIITITNYMDGNTGTSSIKVVYL